MSEWKEYKLGEIINLKRGYDLPNAERKQGSIPIISSSGITDYHNAAMKKAPGVITGRYGTIGQVFFTKEDYWPLNTTLYVQDFRGNDPSFIYYLLTNFDFGKYSDKSAVPGINRIDVHEEIVIVPEVKEQIKIASILSSLDDKIGLLHLQNKTLEQLAETLFRQWFVEEAEGDTIKLGAAIKTTSGGTPSRAKMEYYTNGTIKWVKSKELQGSFILSTEEMVTDEAVKNSSAKLVPANTTLIAMYGATVGEFGILAEPATCNQAVCALIPNEHYPYTFLFIFTKLNKTNLINMSGGSAQQNISQELIRELEFPTAKKRIKEYHAEVEPMFKKIKSNIIQIRTLTQLRDNLLPKLMSGEVRVKMN